MIEDVVEYATIFPRLKTTSTSKKRGPPSNSPFSGFSRRVRFAGFGSVRQRGLRRPPYAPLLPSNRRTRITSKKRPTTFVSDEMFDGSPRARKRTRAYKNANVPRLRDVVVAATCPYRNDVLQRTLLWRHRLSGKRRKRIYTPTDIYTRAPL